MLAWLRQLTNNPPVPSASIREVNRLLFLDGLIPPLKRQKSELSASFCQKTNIPARESNLGLPEATTGQVVAP